VSVGTQPTGRASTSLGAGLGAGRDLRRRLVVHHVPLGVGSTLAVLALADASSPHGGLSVRGLAAPTGDVALTLLTMSLLVGPAIGIGLWRRRNRSPSAA
jgi:hypothetical protein